ncbi:MAG: hypothetical protein AB8G05_00715, partial [Oligoflexales bacterium]
PAALRYASYVPQMISAATASGKPGVFSWAGVLFFVRSHDRCCSADFGLFYIAKLDADPTAESGSDVDGRNIGGHRL